MVISSLRVVSSSLGKTTKLYTECLLASRYVLSAVAHCRTSSYVSNPLEGRTVRIGCSSGFWGDSVLAGRPSAVITAGGVTTLKCTWNQLNSTKSAFAGNSQKYPGSIAIVWGPKHKKSFWKIKTILYFHCSKNFRVGSQNLGTVRPGNRKHTYIFFGP